jgi:hypothetical protein
VEEIVVADRAVPRVLALLPGLAVVVAVRLLTLGAPPVPVRVVAAALIALAGWTAYRLLTASVTVGDRGVRVRGVFYDADVAWAELESVSVDRSGWALRTLLYGVFEPHTLLLSARGRRLRPVAALSRVDDEAVARAVGAMQVRLGAWGVPQPRLPVAEDARVS